MGVMLHYEQTKWHDIDKEPPPFTNTKYLVCGVERLPRNVNVKHFAVLKYGAQGSFIQTGKWAKYIITHWAVVTAPIERVDNDDGT